jgi:hypothetical protein
MPAKLDAVLAWILAPVLVAVTFGFRLVVGAALIVLILAWKVASVCRLLPAPRP